MKVSVGDVVEFSVDEVSLAAKAMIRYMQNVEAKVLART